MLVRDPCHRLTGGVLIVLALVLSGCAQSTASGDGAGPDPTAGSWQTWLLTDADEVAVPPPPEPGSAEAESDADAAADATASLDAEAVEQVERWDVEPAVAPWMEMALDFIAQRSKDPVAASRSYALVATAMYDASVATWHYKHLYDRPGPETAGEGPAAAEPDPSYPSGHAAIAGAASTVLAYAFPEQPAPRLHQQAEEAAESRVLAGVSFPSDAEAGLELGRAVGELVLERAQADVVTDEDLTTREGAANWEELRPDEEGLWTQPPGSVQVPVSPRAGSWETWVLESGDQFRPPPPPAPDSQEFYDAMLEVYEVDQNLTEEQKAIARFWEGGEGTALPPGIWNEVVLAFLADQRLSLPQSARALALLNVA
ncbi:MAG: phosphatase PAP2 family protein, partial [Egibacteraceae bacterium]